MPRKPKKLPFKLPPDCGLKKVERFGHWAATLQSLVRGGGGVPTRQQSQRKEQWLNALRDGTAPQELIQTPADFRFALGLWLESREFLRMAPLDEALLQALQHQLPSPSRLQLWQLLRLYLEQYDQLPSRKKLLPWLRNHLNRQPVDKITGRELRAYHHLRADLLAENAPQRLARLAASGEQSLPTFLRAAHLPEQSRLARRVIHAYYLDPLRALPFGADHPLLTELPQPAVKTLLLEDGLLLGHHAAMILMDRILASEQPPPEPWRQALLDILEDPRVPRAAPRFQTWWARLDQKYLQAMRSWLSHLDLRLFLDILEDVAHSLNKEDLLRMFPVRRRFLEGLFQQGLIIESRLLLSSHAERFIRAQFDADALPPFGRLGNTDISLIYLNVSGVHLVEGTHAFTMRLFQQLPIPGLADYEAEKFSLTELRKYPADRTFRHPSSKRPRWQHEVITTLAQPPYEIAIEPALVLSDEDLAQYRQYFPPEDQS